MASVEDILLARAQFEGDSRRRKGQIWGGVVEGVSQIPGQILRDRAAQADARRAQARQAQADEMAAMELGLKARESERQDAELGIRQDAATSQQRQIQRAKEAVQAWVEQHGSAIDAKQPGYSAAMLAAIETPEGLREVTQQLAKAPEPFKLIERDPTKDLANPVTGEVVVKGAPEAPKVTFGAPQTAMVGGRRTLLRPGSDGAMYDLRGQKIQDASPEPRADAAPSFQAKEVLNDEGKPVMANFDARSGRYIDPSTGQPIANPRPVPSAMETQDSRKFKQAEPILKSVSELSEKINTQQGLIAKIAGATERAKAQANYNDDVAEYEALISGFTPLVARALGHTGVLTQQDVDSVKALFPQPGNSKSLRDRKIARIKSIIGELEAGASGSARPSVAATGAPATIGRFQVTVED